MVVEGNWMVDKEVVVVVQDTPFLDMEEVVVVVDS